jgi:hypothetical protein
MSRIPATSLVMIAVLLATAVCAVHTSEASCVVQECREVGAFNPDSTTGNGYVTILMNGNLDSKCLTWSVKTCPLDVKKMYSPNQSGGTYRQVNPIEWITKWDSNRADCDKLCPLAAGPWEWTVLSPYTPANAVNFKRNECFTQPTQ